MSISEIKNIDQNSYNIELFQGQQITPYLADIAKLLDNVYRNTYPYYFDGKAVGWQRYLTKYTKSADSYATIAFNKNKEIIGAFIGVPFKDIPDRYEDLKGKCKGDNLFYFGEIGVAVGYQNKDVGLKLFQKLELLRSHLMVAAV